jgi:hypothetical protein
MEPENEQNTEKTDITKSYINPALQKIVDEITVTPEEKSLKRLTEAKIRILKAAFEISDEDDDMVLIKGDRFFTNLSDKEQNMVNAFFEDYFGINTSGEKIRSKILVFISPGTSVAPKRVLVVKMQYDYYLITPHENAISWPILKDYAEKQLLKNKKLEMEHKIRIVQRILEDLPFTVKAYLNGNYVSWD